MKSMIWGRGLNICLEKANNSIYYCKRISVLNIHLINIINKYREEQVFRRQKEYVGRVRKDE